MLSFVVSGQAEVSPVHSHAEAYINSNSIYILHLTLSCPAYSLKPFDT